MEKGKKEIELTVRKTDRSKNHVLLTEIAPVESIRAATGPLNYFRQFQMVFFQLLIGLSGKKKKRSVIYYFIPKRKNRKTVPVAVFSIDAPSEQVASIVMVVVPRPKISTVTSFVAPEPRLKIV